MNALFRRHLRALALASLFALPAAGGLTQQARADESRNPFQPVSNAGAAPATNTPLDSLELRGIMKMGDTTLVTLFDTSTSKSVTVELNEGAGNWKVSGYNSADDTVVVQSGALTRTIALRKPKILVAAATPAPGQPGSVAMPLPVPQPIVMPANAGTPVPQMSDQEVRERMNRVAEEIQRRRQMRREMIERTQPQQAQPAQAPQQR
jgi:hypothetical protein